MQSIANLHVLIGDDWDPFVEHRHDHLRANAWDGPISMQSERPMGMQSDAIRRNQTQSDAITYLPIRCNQTQSDAITSLPIRCL